MKASLSLFSLFFLFLGCTVPEESVETSSDIITPEMQRTLQLEEVRLEHPLSIPRLRGDQFPGSEPVMETELQDGSNYSRYIASYLSEGLKQRGLLTIPKGTPPEEGWPVIIFNHGFIPPTVYRTTERYVAYQDAFAQAGFITYKPDYRGHDQSEGPAGWPYDDPANIIDVLNATASILKLENTDSSRVGLWGHSMGGFNAIEAMVIRPNWYKAAVIWGGVVSSPIDRQILWWNRNSMRRETENVAAGGDRPRPEDYRPISIRWNFWRQRSSRETMEANADFWALVSANSYLDDIKGSIQLHHADTDETVPVELSQVFFEELQSEGIPSELYIYEGDNHNLSVNLWLALQRSVDFFQENM